MTKFNTKGKTANQQILDSWSDIKVDDLLMLLQEYYPNNEFRVKGGSIIGQCFYHQDNGPSLHITPFKKKVKCFGNTCGKFVSNPLRFIQDITKGSYSDAVKVLRVRLGVKSLPKALVEKHQKLDTHQTNKKLAADYFRQKLLDAVTNPNAPENLYAQPLVEWLKTRGVVDMHHVMPHGILPPLNEVEKHFYENPDMYEWIKKYFNKYLNGASYLGWFVFFLQDAPDSITRFKLRKPNAKEFVFVEDEFFQDFMGAYGVDFYKEFLGNETYCKTIYVCEGEFDALASFGPQLNSGSTDHIILSLGGNSQKGADFLSPLGAEQICVVGDNDDAGNAWVQDVIGATKKLPCSVFQWPTEFADCKDPDEVIAKLGYEKFKNALHPASGNFQHAHEFLFEQASAEIDKISETDVRRRSRVAEEYGRKLSNLSEATAYIKAIVQTYALDEQVLSQEITTKKEDEELFIDRIVETLKAEFHVIGFSSPESRKQLIHLWYKRTRKTIEIIMGDERSIENGIGQVFGPIIDFIRDHVGEPRYMGSDIEQEIATINLQKKIAHYVFCVKQAFLKLSKGAPDLKSAPEKSQGFHYIGKNDTENYHGYLVNGRDVYKWAWPNNKLNWQKLDGPSDGGIIFDAQEHDTWLPFVEKTEDLSLYTDLDLADTYHMIHDMINKSWSFKYQQVDSEFLAAYVMCLPVMGIFKRQTSVIVNGESGSGKSRLVGGLIGGTQFPRISLIHAVKTLDGYTQASIRQQMNNRTLALVLDEFEDSGNNDKRSIQVRNILDMMRTNISERPVSWTVGGANGFARKYELRFPLICAAVHPLHNEVDLTRFISIEMCRERDHEDPVQVILRNYGDRIDDLRKGLGVGMFQYIPKLIEAYGEIEKEYSSNAKLPGQIISRYKEALYPILSILKVAGLKYHDFAYRFCDQRSEDVAAMASVSENEYIFDAILSTPFQIQSDQNRPSAKTTIRQMLADPTERFDINKTAQGVYYDDVNKWLIVQWGMATTGLLNNNNKYRGQISIAHIKKMAERSPFIIKSTTAKAVSGGDIMERMSPYMGKGIRMDQVSIFNVAAYVDDSKSYTVKTTNLTSEEGNTQLEDIQV